jgi:hypothetical protein
MVTQNFRNTLVTLIKHYEIHYLKELEKYITPTFIKVSFLVKKIILDFIIESIIKRSENRNKNRILINTNNYVKIDC